MRRAVRALFLIAACIAAPVISASMQAGERHVLIVAGASGAPEYAQQYQKWTSELSAVLHDRMKIPPDRIKVLSDSEDPGSAATAANVRQYLGSVRRSMSRDDLLFVVLIGHGTYDGIDAKFNLVGADLESAQWAALLDGLPGQIVLVNTSSASFPFVERLSGSRRIVIAATDSVAQRFDTVFPEFFIKAFQGDTADVDKNARVSIWEAFSAAAMEVRRHYQRKGQLSTERALLDDNGDGVGRDATGNGEDGSLASRTYLDDPLPGATPTDEVLVKLVQKRQAIEAELEDLKIRRAFLKPTEYQQEFERLMVELAKVERDIRLRIKS